MASHLMRFDPFRTISHFEPLSKFGDVLNNLSLAPLTPLAWEELESMNKLDVTETDKTYTVRAEIPGVKKEDIKVDINGNQIMISTEVKRETQEKSSNTVRCER